MNDCFLLHPQLCCVYVHLGLRYVGGGLGGRLGIGFPLYGAVAVAVILLPGLPGLDEALGGLGGTLTGAVTVVVTAGVTAEVGLLVAAAIVVLGHVVVAAAGAVVTGALAVALDGTLGARGLLTYVEITVIQIQIILLYVLASIHLLEKVFHGICTPLS